MLMLDPLRPFPCRPETSSPRSRRQRRKQLEAGLQDALLHLGEPDPARAPWRFVGWFLGHRCINTQQARTANEARRMARQAIRTWGFTDAWLDAVHDHISALADGFDSARHTDLPKLRPGPPLGLLVARCDGHRRCPVPGGARVVVDALHAAGLRSWGDLSGLPEGDGYPLSFAGRLMTVKGIGRATSEWLAEQLGSLPF